VFAPFFLVFILGVFVGMALGALMAEGGRRR
jgi:hypothetical protein